MPNEIVVPPEIVDMIVDEFKNGSFISAIAINHNLNRWTVEKYLFTKHKLARHGAQANGLEDFLNSFTKQSNGCWGWTGNLGDRGYGRITINNKKWAAHRFSYQHFKGPLNNLQVLHQCDNPKCVNPDHLFLGTHQDNMADMKDKGRGGLNHVRKLHPEQVFEIREIIKNRILSDYEIARIYNVHRVVIRRIRIGKSWNSLNKETCRTHPSFKKYYQTETV